MSSSAPQRLGSSLWALSIPIPVSSLGHVTTYLLEAGDGVVLIDSGWDTEVGWKALVAGLSRIGRSITSVRGVMVTHLHPDHFRMAPRIRAESGCWIAMHRYDSELLEQRYSDPEAFADETMQFLLNEGVPTESARRTVLGLNDTPVADFRPDTDLVDSQVIDIGVHELTAIHTPGHTPGHACFYDADRRLLFSGDHVLPRISPHISSGPVSGHDPLGNYLSSLARLESRDVDLVLPAHGQAFRDLTSRLDELTRHHLLRMREIELAVAEPRTAWETARSVRWRRPWSSMPTALYRLAVGETVAHLDALSTRGRVRRMDGPPHRYVAVE